MDEDDEEDGGGEEEADQDQDSEEVAPPPTKAKGGRGRPSKAADSSEEDGSPPPKKGPGRPAAKAGSAKKPTPKKVRLKEGMSLAGRHLHVPTSLKGETCQDQSIVFLFFQYSDLTIRVLEDLNPILTNLLTSTNVHMIRAYVFLKKTVFLYFLILFDIILISSL
jgi:hypothetical protein